MMRKQGFTLIELLVYIVISAIIVGVAGQAFLDATRQRLRTTQMLQSTMGTGDVMTYLNDDLRQMGEKTWMRDSNNTDTFKVVPNVYIDSIADSSSFNAYQVGSSSASTRLDSIDIRYAVYDPTSGKATGAQQVRWKVNSSGTLIRRVLSRSDLNGVSVSSASTSDSVVMANNVVNFKIQYGLQAVQDTIAVGAFFFPCPGVLPSSGSAYTLQAPSGASSASIATGSPAGVKVGGNFPPGEIVNMQLMKCAAGAVGAVEHFTFKSGATYRVAFGLASNDSTPNNFRADLDYLGAGMRNPTTWTSPVTDDYQFYSGLDNNVQQRSFDFTTGSMSASSGSTVSASLVFDYRMRSSSSGAPMATASFTMDSLHVVEVARPGNDWRASFPSPDSTKIKKFVKALNVTIAIKNSTAISTLTKVIPVVSNGTKN